MKHRHHRRLARRNPEAPASLPKEAAMTLASSAIGITGAIGLESLVSGMKNSADQTKAKYSNNAVAGIVGIAGLALGVGLHVKGIAPRVGKAFIAATGALAARRYLAHKADDAATIAGRVPGAAAVYAKTPGVGIQVAPVMVSHGVASQPGAYGYLSQPSAGAVGAQYGTVPSGAAVGAQYGTVRV